MPAWDNAQLPAPPSLVVPKADFSALGDLGQAYYQGQQLQRQQAIQTAFKEGLPKDASGQPDYKAAAQKLFQLGDYAGGTNLLKLEYGLRDTPTQPSIFDPGVAPGSQPAARPSMQPQPVAAEPPGPQAPQGPTQSGIGPIADATVGPAQPIPPDMSTADALGNVRRTGQVVPPQTGPAGPSAPGPQAQVQPQQVSTAAADALVPDRLRGRMSAPNWRDYLRSQQDLATQQAQEANRKNTALGMKIDTAPLLARAKMFGDAADKIDAALAPTEGQKDVAADIPRQKIQQESSQKRGEASYTGIGQVAKLWETGGGKTYNNLAKSILNQPALYTGFGANEVLDLNKVRSTLGGNPNAAMYVEALKKLTAADVLNTINATRAEASEGSLNSQAGRTFQSQVEQAEKTALNTESTLAGNRFLAELKGRMGEYSVRVRNLANDYYSKHKTLDEGFDKIVDADLKSRPLFTPGELKNPSLIGAPITPYSDPGQTMAWAQKMGIKDGDPIRTPGGKIVTLHIPIYPKQQSAPP
jgi:hypothetical protein